MCLVHQLPEHNGSMPWRQQRLLSVAGSHATDSSEGSHEWLCIFADQHWLSHLCQPAGNAQFISSCVAHVESDEDVGQASVPSPAIGEQDIDESKVMESREQKSYEVLTLLKCAYEQMTAKNEV